MSFRQTTLSSIVLAALCVGYGVVPEAFAQRGDYDRSDNSYSQSRSSQSDYNSRSRNSDYSDQNSSDQSRNYPRGYGSNDSDNTSSNNGSDQYSNSYSRQNSSDRSYGDGDGSYNNNSNAGNGYSNSNNSYNNNNNSYNNANNRNGYGQSNNTSNNQNNSARGNNYNATQNTSVSPVLQAAILPKGWQRISGHDVPALPETLPNLPTTVRSDDGVNVTVNDTVRIIASGDDIISVLEAMAIGSRVIAAPEGAVTASGQSALRHLRFDPQLDVSRITNLNGTLFLCGSLRLCRPWATQIRRTSTLPVVIIDDQQSATDRVRKIAAALGMPGQGRGMAEEMQSQFNRAQSNARQMARHPKVLVVIYKDNQAMIAGRGTPPADLVSMAGGVNVGSSMGIDGYGASMDNLSNFSPDVILVSEYDLSHLGGANNFLKSIPQMADTPAARANRVWVMPDVQLKYASVASGTAAVALSQAFARFGR